MNGRPDVLPALKAHLPLTRGADHAALLMAIKEIERLRERVNG